MIKIDYVTHDKNGVNYITLAPTAPPPGLRLKWLDGLFFAGLLAGFIGLILFLAK
jgi:hypothetical protein